MRGDFRDLYKAEGTLTAAQRDVESKLETLILAWFDTIKDDVIEWAEGFLEKVDVPPLGGEDELAAALAEILGEAFTAGASDVIGSLGLDLTTPSESALLYAQDRAAELVGKKWVNGVLIDNPNPEFAITETLRSDINTLVNRGISDGWSPQRMKSELEEIGFGSWRAKTIARTETGFAYGNGAAMVYEESDVQYVLIQDGAGCLPTGHKNGAPAGTGAAGTVETANEANNQVWTVGQYQARVLGHPNCVRGAVPYFPEE